MPHFNVGRYIPGNYWEIKAILPLLELCIGFILPYFEFLGLTSEDKNISKIFESFSRVLQVEGMTVFLIRSAAKLITWFVRHRPTGSPSSP